MMSTDERKPPRELVPERLSRKEAAALLGRTKRTVIRLEESGKLQCTRIDGKGVHYFDRSDVMNLVATMGRRNGEPFARYCALRHMGHTPTEVVVIMLLKEGVAMRFERLFRSELRSDTPKRVRSPKENAAQAVKPAPRSDDEE